MKIMAILSLVVLFTSISSASVLGCRHYEGQAIYQAEQDETGIQLISQKDMEIVEVLAALAGQADAEDLDEGDIEKIVDFIDEAELETIAKGDIIKVSPGTSLTISGSTNATLDGLSAGLYALIENAVTSSVDPGPCQTETVLGCRIQDEEPIYQAVMAGSKLSIVFQKDVGLDALLGDLQGGDGVEQSDADKIIDAVMENEIFDFVQGDQISVVPGTTLLFSGTHNVTVEELTEGLYDIIKGAIEEAVQPCQSEEPAEEPVEEESETPEGTEQP